MSAPQLSAAPVKEEIAHRRLPLDRAIWLGLPALLILVMLFVLPLGQLVLDSFSTADGFSFSRYTDLLTDGLFLPIMWRTIKVAFLVTLIAAAIGYPLAYTAARAPKVVAALILATVALPFFTSTLVRSYAWRALLADNGLINNFLVGIGFVDQPIKLVFNDVGIIIGMSQVLLPLLVLPVFASLKGLDRALPNAAKSLGASPFSAWRTVVFPQSLNGLAAGAALVFISSLGFYTTPALLGGPGVPLIAQRIDLQINTQNEYGPTSAQTTVLLIGVVLLMIVLRKPLGLTAPDLEQTLKSPATSHLLRKISQGAGDVLANNFAGGLLGRIGRVVGELISRVRWVILGAISAFGVVLLVLPQLVIAIIGFSSSNYLEFPTPGYSVRWFEDYFADEFWLQSTFLSFSVALSAAAVATAVGVLAAFAVVRTRHRKSSVVVYLLAMSPMVMPPVVYAVSLFFVFARFDLLGQPIGLVIAYTVMGIPYVMITSQAVIRGIDPLYERAAASLGASGLKRAFGIVLPLTAPAVVTSLLFAFIMAFDDLILGIFLGSAKVVTLQVRMYQDIHFEISPKIAAVGVLLTLVMLAVGALAGWFQRRRNQQV